MNQMKLRRNSFSFVMTIRPSKEGINTNMLVSSCFIGLLVIWMAPVLSHRRGVEASQEIPKSANNHRSHMISAIVVSRALSSASILEQDSTTCFLDFHA
ncbi:CW-type Zinc Finger [Zea mays]|uniref:CW-type Zinc Finger n=1 Tax=Zea mays TaxID=4577 RepID=A0A1D6F435_MAIZE|nr:CW-type Zinc Finger [Zea mays]